MANFRFDPCLNCCGGCPVCKHRLTPTYIQVELSGIANGSGDGACTNCDELNATFILPLQVEYETDTDSGTVAHCNWFTSAMYGSASNPTQWACDQDPWQRITTVWFLITLLDDQTYDLQVWLYSDFAWPHYGTWVVYQTNVGQQAPDCMHFDNLELAYQWSNTEPGTFHALGCDVASSTCKVSTVSSQKAEQETGD